MSGIDITFWQEFGAKLLGVFESITESRDDVVAIQSRIKTPESIQYKLERKELNHVGMLSDVVGIRITVKEAGDIEPLFVAVSSELTVIETIIRESRERGNQSLPLPISDDVVRVTTENPFDVLTLVVMLDERRANLPEWRTFARCRAEVQVLTSFADAWLRAEHAWAYKRTRDEPRPDLATLKVTLRLSAILEEFAALLEDPNIHEKRDIHPFLEKHPFLLHPNPADVFSEVAIGLGTEYRVDFLVREADSSYVLVEIENVKHRLFNANGDFTAQVGHAQRQVEDWQQWIDENLSLVQRHYPDIVSPKGLVVIGRSRDLSREERARLARRNANLRGRLTIWTYDDLLENARQFVESLQRYL